MADDGDLNLMDSWRFIRDLMTLPVMNKDPTIDGIVHTAKKNSIDVTSTLPSSANPAAAGSGSVVQTSALSIAQTSPPSKE